MTFLFDSTGQHIANVVQHQLHAPTGENIGHFMLDIQAFIDMQGFYLGEVVMQNRLLFRIGSPYQSVSYGSFGNHGNVGNYGNPGNHGGIGAVGGFRDIATPWLR